MYSVSDLQKLVQMLDYLGFAGNIAPPHSVVIGGGWVTPGASGTLFASNGPAADPSFETLNSLGIQPALSYTPAHAGANSDITSLSGLSTPLSISQGGTGAATAALARTALGAAASGANTDIISLSSPALGSATATTQPRGTNNSDVATTAYVLRQAPFVNILDYGGDPTGVLDNSAAFASALAACTSGRVCIYFPPGKYVFTSTISYTFPSASASIALIGAGSDVTELSWQGAVSGIHFDYVGSLNSVTLQGFSCTTNQTLGVTGLLLNQTNPSIPNPANSATNTINDITFRGDDGYLVTHVWGNAVVINGVSNVNLVGCTFVGNNTATAGIGIITEGPSSNCQGVAFSLIACFFNFLNIGIVYGAWSQGIFVTSCNFTGGNIGIQCPISAGGQDQLIVTGCQFNSATAAMQLNQPVPGLMVSNNLIILQSNNARGITANNYSNFQIVGNQFGAPSLSVTGTIGIYLDVPQGGATAGGVISANTFVSLAGAVNLDTSSTRINVQSNSYLNCTSGVTNSGTGNTLGGVTGATN